MYTSIGHRTRKLSAIEQLHLSKASGILCFTRIEPGRCVSLSLHLPYQTGGRNNMDAVPFFPHHLRFEVEAGSGAHAKHIGTYCGRNQVLVLRFGGSVCRVLVKESLTQPTQPTQSHPTPPSASLHQQRCMYISLVSFFQLDRRTETSHLYLSVLSSSRRICVIPHEQKTSTYVGRPCDIRYAHVTGRNTGEMAALQPRTIDTASKHFVSTAVSWNLPQAQSLDPPAFC